MNIIFAHSVARIIGNRTLNSINLTFTYKMTVEIQRFNTQSFRTFYSETKNNQKQQRKPSIY